MKFYDRGNRFYAVKGMCSKTREYVRRSVPGTHRYMDDQDAETCVHDKYVVAVAQVGFSNNLVVDHTELPAWARAEIRAYTEQKQRVTLKTGVTPGNNDAYSILHLIPSAPGYIVDAVWKALVKVHHPDKGGDEETFKRLADAYAKIKGR